MEISNKIKEAEAPRPKKEFNFSIIYDVLFLLILVVAAYFRLTGFDWEKDQHVHPDERFLTEVTSLIYPVNNFDEYFDTHTSTLNPHNHGKGFYVYGTLPIFSTRYMAEWMGTTGYGEVKLVGRILSANADLLLVAFVYLAGSRLYGKKVGLLASAFSAFSVMQIQLSHFFVVDNFLNLFTFIAIYFAIRIATGKKEAPERNEEAEEDPWQAIKYYLGNAPFNLLDFILFGVAFGLALSSKINSFPVALLLPLAVAFRFFDFKKSRRENAIPSAFLLLVIAGLASFVTFRIFQPYAFDGPGILGIIPNEKWVANIREIMAQSSGEQDWPPSIQWARRPVWFSFQNLVTFGLGLPLGISAWAGFLWMGWKIFRGQWRKHLLLWLWVGAYFVWQSRAFNPTMRYQLLIYPGLTIFAGWFFVTLWKQIKEVKSEVWRQLGKGAVAVLTILVLLGTFTWAYAFTSIYTRTESRTEASRWIYENVPGPITLNYGAGGEVFNQPITFGYEERVSSDDPRMSIFVANKGGILEAITVKDVLVEAKLSISQEDHPESPIIVEKIPLDFKKYEIGSILTWTMKQDYEVPLIYGEDYLITIELPEADGGMKFNLIDLYEFEIGESAAQPILFYPEEVQFGETIQIPFNVDMISRISNIQIQYVFPETVEFEPVHLIFELSDSFGKENLLSVVKGDIVPVIRLGDYTTGTTLTLDEPVFLEQGKTYYLHISKPEGSEVYIAGASPANETVWDMGLPFPVDGYNGYGGLYQRELLLRSYWNGDANKRNLLLETLEDSEYIFISSSRQWGSTPRIPERYPLNVVLYNHLMGCPDDISIEYCYNVAEIGMFEEGLGFDLIHVGESNPEVYGIEINDQFAEEAFTVYDHSKIFVFRKTADYDQKYVDSLFFAVDVSLTQHVTPKQAGGNVIFDPVLPEEVFESQKESGTWSDIFKEDSLINSFAPLTVVVWYLAIFLLGLTVFPLVRAALPGLNDNGYPLARIAGMLLLAFAAWQLGSAGVYFTPLTIGLVWLGLASVSGIIVWRNREEYKELWRQKRNYLLLIELIFLGLFIFSLLVRIANPDLWHPYKGGEKPMDFAYFNAVLKSNTFPPYDPWFAGGYLNYYYFGFVLAAVPVKLLGIVPAVAYNLIIPTIFGMIAIGAFSAAWNLVMAFRIKRNIKGVETEEKVSGFFPWIFGGMAAAMTALLGNMGPLVVVSENIMKLGAMAAPGGWNEQAALFTKAGWLLKGIFNYITGGSLNIPMDHWYWNPSRIIPAFGEVAPITEFPWFTIIYADLHAHLMALPLTLLALSWVISVALSKAWKKQRTILNIGWSLLFGAIVVGSLYPTNTWDLPTYLVLGIVVLIYAVLTGFKQLPLKRRVITALAIAGAFAALALAVYKPFADSYVTGYSSLERWEGTTTALGSYLAHWGLFLFLITGWLAWETRQWLAATPVSAWFKLKKQSSLLIFIGVVVITAIIILMVMGVKIAPLVGLLGAWTIILLIRKNLPPVKRLVIFLIGTGLFLTLLVEVFVLKGDIARMNTVFKFYLQVWVLFGVSGAVVCAWTIAEMNLWANSWKRVYQILAVILFGIAIAYPVTATIAKIKDRMNMDAPMTIDGLKFMETSQYYSVGGLLDINQDYKAIRWMQQEIEGSPIIVEGHTVEYNWGSRYSIYTGLPSVIGWNWHQRQQRGIFPGGQVQQRVDQTHEFYQTTDRAVVEQYLEKYEVDYVILGQLERGIYEGDGLLKFPELDGVLWETVYSDRDTVIYKVLDLSTNQE